MFKTLQCDNADSATAVGDPIHNIRMLKAAGIRIAPTFVIGTELFHEYSKHGRLPDESFDNFIKVLSKEKLFAKHHQVVIRTSLSNWYAGLLEEIIAEKTNTAIRYGIEAIYRSWSDVTARANRHVYEIDEASSIPSLYLQPAYVKPLRLATRTGNGEVTNNTNFNKSIRNTTSLFRPLYISLLRNIEHALAFPTEITLTDTRSPLVITASRDTITDLGTFRTLSELLRDKVMNELDFLLRIKPEMLIQFTTFSFSDPHAVTIENGIPASPGAAVGRMLVLRSRQQNDYHGSILAFDDACPEDVDAISQCSGVITTKGGMTSHAAVVCRGFHKPMVINYDLKINTSDARVDHEFLTEPIDHSWHVCINGSIGSISFSRQPSIAARYAVKADCANYLDTIVIAMNRYDNLTEFSKLSIESQLHLARLRSELRKVGAVE